MYIIRDKKTNEIKCVDRREKEPKLKASTIYPDFNAKTMEFGYTAENYLPARFHIDKKGIISEWTLEEKVEAGLPELSALQKLESGEVVDKSMEEIIDEKLFTLEELKATKLEHFSALSFQLREVILPSYKLENAGLGVYDETKTANYRETVKAFKTEFSRIRNLINAADSATEIEKVKEAFPREIVEVTA